MLHLDQEGVIKEGAPYRKQLRAFDGPAVRKGPKKE